MSRTEKTTKNSTLNVRPIKKISGEHKALLERRKNCGIGPVERLKLWHAGRTDGKIGLPKEISENVWMSVFMDQEYTALQEKFSRLWGLQHNRLEPLYAEEGILLDRIHYNIELLSHSGFGKQQKTDPEKLKARKSGEEHLSDDIVAKRRNRELYRQNSGERAKAEGLKNQIRKDYERLIDLSNRIDEANTGALMCSQRLSEHAGQRMDVYWRAAIFAHPLKEEIPVVPGMSFDDTEKVHYFEAHQELTEAVADAIRKYRKEIGTVDSACGQKQE